MTLVFLVDHIIALQDPANDDATFKKFRETNGQDLVSLIRKWEYGCKEMESRMNLMIDRIRKESLQEDGGSFSFWHNTNFETIPLLPYQSSNVPKPEIPINQGPSTSRYITIHYNIFLWSFQTKGGKFNRQFTWKRFRYS